MGFYENHVLPHLIEWACAARPVAAQRRRILPEAEGQVVEIGLGSGHNLPYYDADRVKAVIGVDPSDAILARAARRAAEVGFPVEMAALEGEHLPFESDFADTVVVTYSLCTIPDPAQALSEMRRVLKPGGRLLFAEHGAAPDAVVRRWQERLDRLFWPKISGGCHLARHPDRLIEAAGFGFEHIERAYLPQTPRPFGFNYLGAARPR